jgi:predicted AAA+ superfamily ATPase
VHRLIERDGNSRQYILTGSSARKLKRSGVDLLAGRAVIKFCHPLLASEMGDDFNLEDALVRGMIPLVITSDNWRETLATYMALYIREEVQYEGLVRNLPAFSRFLEAISFSHGALYSATDISRDCGVSRPMVDSYLSILIDLLVAARLPPFTRRAKRRLVGHDKFYFFDAGVFRSIRPCGPLDAPSEIDGAALEGLVFQQLRTWIDYSGTGDTLSFWRTHTGHEVDFIVYGNNRFDAIEVKNAVKLSPKDFSGLKAFATDYPEARRILLYRGTERLSTNGVLCIPVSEFLKGLVVSS